LGALHETSRLRCAELLTALSLITDLGMGNPPETAMRGCLIATRLAVRLGLDDRTTADVYYTTLLRYVGCTAPAHEQAFISGGDDIGLRAHRGYIDSRRRRESLNFILKRSEPGEPRLLQARQLIGFLLQPGIERQMKTADCEVASNTARRLGLSHGVQQALHEIFERWDGRGAPDGLHAEAITLPARFAQVVTLALLLEGVVGGDRMFELIGQRAAGQLDPWVTRAFLQRGPELLQDMSGVDLWQAVLEAEPSPHETVGEHGFDNIARAFGDLVDLKTPYMSGHASGVAELAEGAARHLKLEDPAVAVVRHAALLHDIGRAGVTNSAWERPGQLTNADWEQVRLHAYHSERILSRSPALAPLAVVAGMHHERQDGSGYHRQVRSTAIPLQARVVAASDVYQALTQDRPHRPAYSAESAADRLTEEARQGRLDQQVVEAVLTTAGHERHSPRGTWPAGLSNREVEVLRLVARGCSTREIARKLVISPKTADHHVQHVYAKIAVSTRASATLFALEHDLLRD
jgi:HD-GYP domain-containing protein (c-di-GMP phosphodiesterase class II)/DNA-binding CsgD family transcriptional regulator